MFDGCWTDDQVGRFSEVFWSRKKNGRRSIDRWSGVGWIQRGVWGVHEKQPIVNEEKGMMKCHTMLASMWKATSVKLTPHNDMACHVITHILFHVNSFHVIQEMVDDRWSGWSNWRGVFVSQQKWTMVERHNGQGVSSANENHRQPTVGLVRFIDVLQSVSKGNGSMVDSQISSLNS